MGDSLMSVSVTSHRYSQNLRNVGIGLAAVGVLALVVLGLVDRVRVELGTALLLGSCVFAALAGFAGVFVHLEQQPAIVKFRALDDAQRGRALLLAWKRPPSADLRPFKLALWSAAAVLVLVAVAPAAGGGLAVALVVVAAAAPAGVAFARDRVIARPIYVKFGLRGAGVAFVCAHADEWTAQARSKCEDLGLGRFRLEDPARKAYALWWLDAASAVASDMPPQRMDFTVLAVGEFVGFRSGYVMNLKAVSEAHAAEAEPDVVVPGHVKVLNDHEMEREREAHYRDIVNIDYGSTDLSQGPAVGVLKLGLSNGEKIEYRTDRDGPPWKAALENIRKRTREVKLGETRAPSPRAESDPFRG